MNAPYYTIDQLRCTYCAGCASVCPQLAIVIYDTRSEINDSCNGCGCCETFCPVSAIREKSE